MRIAILTFHRAYNCGAMLQAWALKTVLERMGHTVEFPVLNHVGEEPRWRPWFSGFRSGLRWGIDCIRRFEENLLSIPVTDISYSRYRSFRCHYLPERFCSIDELEKHYDLIIAGSDQIWNPVCAREDAPLFRGEGISAAIRKIAYAASMGDNPLQGEELSKVVACLDRFDRISVRERLPVEVLSKFTNRTIDETLDPTLLLTAEDYAEIAGGSVPNEPYLFAYILWTDSFFMNTIRALAQRLGVRCIIAPCYQYSRYRAPKDLTYGISPDRLVQYARHAKYVVAASFHGTVMGVTFNKPFLSLRAQVDEHESRPASLLRLTGCEDRLVNPTTSLDEMERLLRTEIDPESVKRLEAARRESLAWLSEAIKGK